ncbi:hypothetical protein CVT24_013186 [Panaeolus cyanescens]|uniref:mRNA-capping enzyme subunit beta n=1 Tax=Panaeolus cyanescens TaxID=181874 RepID=A0A409WAH7_9AGAR|nr:hypothetical protein CVT24_013186 [Panaeolus cyanescens]
MHRRDDKPPPMKRARQDSSSQDMRETPNNGHAQGSQLTLPPLSLSILGVEPMDEFIKQIADFIHHMIMTRPLTDVAPQARVEVEAKIGLLRDKSSGQRLSLPILSEAILAPGVDVRFESNMSSNQHRHFNNLLNQLKTASDQPNHPSTPLGYTHHYLVDSFFPPSDQGLSLGHPYDREKIRVTRDEKSGTVIESVRKIRLGDLNIVSPKNLADWRVSVNLEVPMPHPVGIATHKRRKDRLSYTHEEFVIDLTQVTTSAANEPPQVLHELEIEIMRPELLLASAAKRLDPNASEHEKSAFDELIRAFVNNARILARNSSEGWQ